MEFFLEKDTGPRAGRIVTPHGEVETPAFMPVGTRGAVKALTAAQVRETGAQMILANTYHLSLRPGLEIVEGAGGLHGFMGWEGPILTDSGGFQVFSLAALRRVTDQGVTFQSHYDGNEVSFTPRSVVEAQNRLGSDIVMPLDHCVSYPVSRQEAQDAMERTLRWARASRDAEARGALFGIVQGGAFRDLRQACADDLVGLDLPGYAVGGLSVGEEKSVMEEVLSWTLPRLPQDRPRYVMGVGPPATLLSCIAQGADMFDCVLPTRNARNAYLFTRAGVLRIRNAAHAKSTLPVDPECRCVTCRTVSRSYLRHLFNVGEILAMTLATIHNLTYFHDLMAGARQAILKDRFDAFRREVEEVYP